MCLAAWAALMSLASGRSEARLENLAGIIVFSLRVLLCCEKIPSVREREREDTIKTVAQQSFYIVTSRLRSSNNAKGVHHHY